MTQQGQWDIRFEVYTRNGEQYGRFVEESPECRNVPKGKMTLKQFEVFHQNNPKAFMEGLMVGGAMVEQGRYRDASEVLRLSIVSAVRLIPDDFVGRMSVEHDDWSFEFLQLYVEMSKCMVAGNKYEEAIEMLQYVVKMCSDEAAFVLRLIDLLVYVKQDKEAFKQLDGLQSGYALYYRAVLHLRAGNKVAAVTCLRKSALKNPYLMSYYLGTDNVAYIPHVADKFEDDLDLVDTLDDFFLDQLLDMEQYALVIWAMNSSVPLMERARWAGMSEQYLQTTDEVKRNALWMDMMALVEAVHDNDSEQIVMTFEKHISMLHSGLCN